MALVMLWERVCLSAKVMIEYTNKWLSVNPFLFDLKRYIYKFKV